MSGRGRTTARIWEVPPVSAPRPRGREHVTGRGGVQSAGFADERGVLVRRRRLLHDLRSSVKINPNITKYCFILMCLSELRLVSLDQFDDRSRKQRTVYVGSQYSKLILDQSDQLTRYRITTREIERYGQLLSRLRENI